MEGEGVGGQGERLSTIVTAHFRQTEKNVIIFRFGLRNAVNQRS